MIRRTLPQPAFYLLFLLVIAACAPTPVQEKLYPQHTGRLEVIASGFANDQGTAAFALFSHSENFPNAVAGASRRITAPIVDGRSVAVFSDIPYGYYAVSVLHDLNNNAAMDRNLLGWPLEAHGLSRDARGFFGPPSFDDARFGFFAEQAVLRIHMEHPASIREQRRKVRQLQRNSPNP